MESTFGAGPPPHRLIRFNGYSMYPFLRNGDRLVVRTRTVPCPAIGDIVMRPENAGPAHRALVAHRIIQITPEGRLITKGDNMQQPDKTSLTPGEIVGVVVMVLRGRHLNCLTGAWPRRRARAVATLSRWNLTPALVAASFKKSVSG